jgi:diguanylate cyclase (GGDEF)-like protein
MTVRTRCFTGFYTVLATLVAVAGLQAWALGSPNLSKHGLAALSLGLMAPALVVVIRARIMLSWRLQMAGIAERDRDRLLTTDALTGAVTRETFMAALQAAVSEGRRRAVSLLLIDVDHFKGLNDAFGHPFGDLVLRELVTTAKAAFPGAPIGRLGGDEFGVLLSGRPCETLAQAERFLSTLRLPRSIAGRPLGIGASLGLATVPDHTDFADDLMLFADLALYESKRSGRNRVTAFDGSMMQDQQQQRFIERELRAAILLDELEVHYQPIVGLDGQVTGAEALVRWRHPVRGMMMPGEFIAVAERSLLIDMLGEWVLRRVCRDLPDLPGQSVSVNVSGAQLKRDALVEMVERVLTETGTPARRLIFEITETVAVAQTPCIARRLARLRTMGTRIALDDVGTGHTGFQSLHRMPVDIIKIDRSYVQALGTDPVASILVSALSAIGRARGIEIVAEGIETEDHLALAKAGGCSLFQGYHIGRPAPIVSRPAAIAA